MEIKLAMEKFSSNFFNEVFMKCNVGRKERGVRIVLGLFLLSLVFFGPETQWGYIGLIPLITGLIGYCPLYSLSKFRLFPYD